MSRNGRESAKQLSRVAHAQGGYFTSKQAQDAGYGYRHLDYHESAGNFERVERGLYRLPTIPISEHDELFRLSLWSRNRADELQAVVSHESALFLHQLSDVLPKRIHLTVPARFRKTPPAKVVLHKKTLKPNDTDEWQGLRVTTPQRTLLDVAVSGTDRQQLEAAVLEAISKGMVRNRKLEEAVNQSRRYKSLKDILARIGKYCE